MTSRWVRSRSPLAGKPENNERKYISMKLRAWRVLAVSLAGFILLPTAGRAQEDVNLAQLTQNPVADLISVPFQNNTNFGLGPNDRTQNVLNIQPVVPLGLSANWNLITRTIVPVIVQPDLASESGSTTGLGDILFSAFLSPGQPGKVIWGVGPAISLPTGKEGLSSEKWALGPSIVVLTMSGPWVAGVLWNNIWSVAGDDDRPDTNNMLVQYFINYNLPNGWYLISAPIITANWKASSGNKWVVPFGAGAGKVFRVGKQPLNASLQAYVNAVKPDDFGADWTLRAQLQFLFPK